MKAFIRSTHTHSFLLGQLSLGERIAPSTMTRALQSRGHRQPGAGGSGANFIKCMFLSGERLVDSSGQDRGPNSRSGGCFSGSWFEVELLFLDFLRQFDAADRHGRRLEALEPEHRPDPLLYSPVILLDQVVEVFARSHLYAAR